MAVERVRPLFDGIERSDSFVVDPHKWLFAPFDCAALLYRDPLARATHTQHAEYLDVVTETDDWNPSDYAFHLFASSTAACPFGSPSPPTARRPMGGRSSTA